MLTPLMAQELTKSALKAMGAPNNPKVEIAWNSVVTEILVWVTLDVEYLHFRANLVEAFPQFSSTHLGHHHVSNE